jgi:uncharacterized glyoxalase superfamily protein PhnB
MGMPNIEQFVPLLTVYDVQRSVDFYVGVLGFQVERQHPSDGPPSWATLRRGDVKLMLNDEFEPDERRAEHDRLRSDDVSFYLWTKGLEAVHALLVGQGCKVGELRTEYYGMKQFDLHDPDGYRLTLQAPADEDAE